MRELIRHYMKLGFCLDDAIRQANWRFIFFDEVRAILDGVVNGR